MVGGRGAALAAAARPMRASLWICALLAACQIAAARRFHDERKHKHWHTYLSFCVNNPESSTPTIVPADCIQGVAYDWPEPAMAEHNCNDPSFPVKGSAPPHVDMASVDIPAVCRFGEATSFFSNFYLPISIPLGIVAGKVAEDVQERHGRDARFRRGADVDTLQSTDRIRCVDGQILATSYNTRYTPQECARLCARIKDFDGHSGCTHFSRQWIRTDINEHEDNCGRDGDDGTEAGLKMGDYGSAGLGTGSYKYMGQCIFFDSPALHCCATKMGYHLTSNNVFTESTETTHCEDKFGEPRDNFDTKHRTWRVYHKGHTPSAAWPTRDVESYYESTRRLASVENSTVHEFVLPNGTLFWAAD